MATPLPFHKRLADLPVYQPGRPIEEVARELGMPAAGIIKLASNENPLGPSPRAMVAMQEAVAQMHRYPDGNAYYLKRELASHLSVEPAHVILGNGSNELIEFVGHVLLEPGTDIVVSQYCFAIYPIIGRMFGADVRVVPARNHGHDIPAMLKAITDKTRIIFVANPNNPTGTLAPIGDVVRLVNEVPPHVLLVMDEAYIEFLDNPCDLVPLVTREDRPNLLLMRTFSKIYGLAGLRIGYGIGHPEVISALERIRQPFNINAMAQAGALAALGDHEHLRRTKANNSQGLELFDLSLRRLGLKFVPSSANFVLVEVGDGNQVFQAMQSDGVIVRPMAGYQLPNWVRISLGTAQENSRCLDALKKALAAGQRAHAL